MYFRYPRFEPRVEIRDLYQTSLAGPHYHACARNRKRLTCGGKGHSGRRRSSATTRRASQPRVSAMEKTGRVFELRQRINLPRICRNLPEIPVDSTRFIEGLQRQNQGSRCCRNSIIRPQMRAKTMLRGMIRSNKMEYSQKPVEIGEMKLAAYLPQIWAK